MLPRDRISPSGSITDTVMLSACTSRPTNRISCFIDRLLSHVALRYVRRPTRSVTYDAANRSRSFHDDSRCGLIFLCTDHQLEHPSSEHEPEPHVFGKACLGCCI